MLSYFHFKNLTNLCQSSKLHEVEEDFQAFLVEIFFKFLWNYLKIRYFELLSSKYRLRLRKRKRGLSR